MKVFVVMQQTFLALAIFTAIGVGGITLAHHTGKGQVKVTQLSQRDIIEKLGGKDASATVVEVTFEPGQKDSPHRHAGPVFGYVLEGEYEHAIDDEPVKTYKAGTRSTNRRDACIGWPRTQATRTRPASWRSSCTRATPSSRRSERKTRSRDRT